MTERELFEMIGREVLTGGRLSYFDVVGNECVIDGRIKLSEEEMAALRAYLMEEPEKPMKPLYSCSDCGMSLDLEQWQLDWVIEHGNPIPRPPCPKNENGQHRVDDPFKYEAQW